jgi:hypothetical protein
MELMGFLVWAEGGRLPFRGAAIPKWETLPVGPAGW